ncbi:MAG: ECF transporter S component [Oscillibacter sp.]|nr:ECF transporter S component [Oscillibacter sp.]
MSKQTLSPRAAQSRSIHDLVILALFTAIIFLMNSTPLGYIDLPIIKATLIHVPVIIGSILLGPRKGAFLGGMFGLTSFLKNSMTPSALSFAFSPLIPVYGTDHGSPWALVICFVPRILVGVTPWLTVQALKKLTHNHAALRPVVLGAAGVVGAFTNTALVMGLIYVAFKDAYALLQGVDSSAVMGLILGVVAGNGVPEAIVALVLAPAVCIPLIRALKLDAAGKKAVFAAE